jgi:cytochrome o ubiquinol oxidase subunit 3
MSNLVTNVGHAHGDHGHDDHHHDSGEMTVYGFWLYLMTDCILFASIFAVYAVLVNNVAGGPSGHDIFELPYVLGETALLLFSSITYGFAMLALFKGNKKQVLGWLFMTFLFGLGFIGMEINEFHLLISEGYGPSRSAASCRVLHPGRHPRSARDQRSDLDGDHDVSGQQNGLTATNKTRLSCLSLFWHFLDVVWICVFTVVYLMGTL